MKKHLVDLIYSSDLYATRFLLGFAELVWAITLLWPGDTFGRPTYFAMQRLTGEEVWGVIFLVSAICQFAILRSRCFHSPAAVFFAGWNSILWITVVVSMYMSVYPPPAAISGELALALGSSWIFVRSGSVSATTKQSQTHGRIVAG